MEIATPEINLSIIAPELIMSAFGLAILLLGAFLPGKGRNESLGYISLLGILLAFSFTLPLMGTSQHAFNNMIAADGFGVFFKVIFLIIAILTVLISMGYAQRVDIPLGEYYALMMSISIYVLAGIIRGDTKSIESAMKYFILGAFATGFLLYGMALVYGSTGSINLAEIAAYIKSKQELLRSPMIIIGIALLTIGFGFKVATVPFHMWTPDVYEGAPTSITAFMATGVKAAGFAGFVRVFFSALGPFQPDWIAIMWVLAVATMTVGNVVAIAQNNIKRMLAYSSIAHAGYILVAFVAGNDLGAASILFYLLVYAFMNIGAFTVVILLGKKGEENVSISDYAGIGFKYPFLGISMTIFLLSMAGIPPLGGFMGKFYVFSAAVKAKYYWLAIIGVLNSAISVYYYLRVTVLMYFREPEREITGLTFSPASVIAVIISMGGVLFMGIFPASVLAWAKRSIMGLM
jgi:NADH-quinone oxidoreductase subunit N